ncbi:MAG TPA: hypothetical protein PLZ51_23180, partial [Aggregatilineales bacterium]|nr:hypothetical protein [Aggregatilineales bacterium]
VPDYGRLPAEFATEESLSRYCVKIWDVEVCWGKGPVLSNTPEQGTTAKICKGIKGKIICFLVEELVSAIWDWWNEDESTEAQVDPRVFDPRFTTVFVPANGNSTGDQSTNDGNDYPFCEDLMNRVIEQHTTSDGSSPVQSEIVGDYLVTYLVLNPEIPLPEPEPCVKWVDAAVPYELEDVLISGYRVQYDSWPPAGWHTDILGGNSTVPMMALLLPAVQKVREAAHRTPYDGALVIDFLGNSTVDEDGGVFFGFVVPEGGLEAAYMKYEGIKGS